ncbi:hypothetical protein BEWA_009090 [Theileria equi strain WA]|uniref:Uncharacterized protein n=1 Tax=Theileria equi strain WA TaxID=1537102 RepID=L0B0W5_THEEQ|nr:hypothetical protein BEWA_009090 [Theileria equi strain WA]AFZ81497.1 hypothetical protein BEWA_009090 [Theileria equi strain WA]|eukprot:XP_004831163.1 hypothetical protein BEWA_009090 [Theileria equi strain WA]
MSRQFGPRDIENALKSHFKHSDTFFDKVRAENSTQERQKSIENEANSLLNSLRERIVYAHES